MDALKLAKTSRMRQLLRHYAHRHQENRKQRRPCRIEINIIAENVFKQKII